MTSFRKSELMMALIDRLEIAILDSLLLDVRHDMESIFRDNRSHLAVCPRSKYEICLQVSERSALKILTNDVILADRVEMIGFLKADKSGNRSSAVGSSSLQPIHRRCQQRSDHRVPGHSDEPNRINSSWSRSSLFDGRSTEIFAKMLKKQIL
jgi:hypothetical protein